ncbi:hypothetical protein [Candidatus Thiothrix anitrata]|uniref:DUF465 domain-containing protein n=1 Tax=Candidatus Thiothrix anitrata TaxID=2823902 RepID=A0ABX7X0S6_9GAMM|nr:hypothetical protein [Candidatus Thiothrix anitrata]QTR49296.1 hypothetical protein J8380_13675 [Candidatus Thiothrix anitrata]
MNQPEYCKRQQNKNPQLNRLQQKREQLQQDLAELQDDLKIVQNLIRHKQQKLRALNQDIVTKTRHVTPVLVCLNGGRTTT